MTPVVRRAVLPAAGRGTRMAGLPGGGPKELRPVGGVPMVFYAVVDLLRSGIDELIVVTAPDKPEIPAALHAAAQTGEGAGLLGAWAPYLARCALHVVIQPEPRGLADAVACAADRIGDAPFVCALPDNVLLGAEPAAASVISTFARVGCPTVGLVPVPQSAAGTFGNCGSVTFEPLHAPDDPAVQITQLADKGTGQFADATGTGWRNCGLSVLTPEFLAINAELGANAAGEWDDVPVFQRCVERGRFFGHRLPHRCFDAGNPAGYAAANDAGVRLPVPPEASARV